MTDPEVGFLCKVRQFAADGILVERRDLRSRGPVLVLRGVEQLSRHRVEDGRKTSIRLTPHGKKLVPKLNQHWSATFAVIEKLEGEIGHPLRCILEDAKKVSEQQGFAQRPTHIKLGQPRGINP